MRISILFNRKEKDKMKKEWNWWFAWHPVEADHSIVWMGWVQRKGKANGLDFSNRPCLWSWTYRLKGEE